MAYDGPMGMNPENAEKALGQIAQGLQQVQTFNTTAQQIVEDGSGLIGHHLNGWQGDDAVQWRERFRQEVITMLAKVDQSMQDLYGRLQANIAEQRRISSPGGG